MNYFVDRSPVTVAEYRALRDLVDRGATSAPLWVRDSLVGRGMAQWTGVDDLRITEAGRALLSSVPK